MVKGVSRQVVVVRCPDARFFDQAIFLVRDELLGGPASEQLMKDACRAADAYIRHNTQRRRLTRGRKIAIGALAAAAVGALTVWLLLY